jgi:hypothetical protein
LVQLAMWSNGWLKNMLTRVKNLPLNLRHE